jgi:ATP-binding cassette subfamily B protein
MRFPTSKQRNKNDCGPTCLKIILKHYGISLTNNAISSYFTNASKGTSFKQLTEAAQSLGFEAKGIATDIYSLRKLKLPSIIHWQQKHFVVVYKVNKTSVKISDPAPGILLEYSIEDFLQYWTGTNLVESKGYVLTLVPQKALLKRKLRNNRWSFLFKNYIGPFKQLLSLALIGLLIGVLLSIITPFLTKAIVDVGITNNDFHFIGLVLIAQLVIAISSITLSLIRSWIFVKISSRINLSLVSKFLYKVMKLPIPFYDSTLTGDIIQRINDNNTVRFFISASTITTIFSFLNIVIFGGILAYYNIYIFFVYLFFSALYIVWVLLFSNKRKEYDYKYFERNAESQNIFLQIMSGIRDIRLYNYEEQKRWEWEENQVLSYKITLKQTILSQYQQAGSGFIDILKNILISYLSVRFVIEGMMLSIQYIIGQLNIPILNFISFSNSLQDALIAIERVNDIYELDEEANDGSLKAVPMKDDLIFEKVSFSYQNSEDSIILNNISFKIPKGKITAIVGGSGSGKTSIIKLLVKFYKVTKGNILIGDLNLNDLDNFSWRDRCGVVMQDGVIFNESFAGNIAFGDKDPDMSLVIKVTKLVNLHDVALAMPDGYNTKIGTEINNVSQGQKQRLLIARILYKNPDYIFLDEPTNSLDPVTEKTVMENILEYFKGKTVVIVAHRLKTIENADQIIVMDNGRIVETGDNRSLLQKGGLYYKMKNINN